MTMSTNEINAVSIKKFFWQVYKPKSLDEWIQIPWFARITVGYRYYVDGQYVGTNPYLGEENDK